MATSTYHDCLGYQWAEMRYRLGPDRRDKAFAVLSPRQRGAGSIPVLDSPAGPSRGRYLFRQPEWP